MTIPLDRLRDFPHKTPGPGEISLAVARHQAERWPSPEVTAYAQHRAQLVHQLVDDTGVSVTSWGETDGEYPREVVEIVLALAVPLISSIGVVLAAWISRPSKAKRDVKPDRPKPPPTPRHCCLAFPLGDTMGPSSRLPTGISEVTKRCSRL